MPLIMLDRRRSGAETGVRSGMWSAIALNIKSMVIRARLAPPNPKCGLGSRKMSKANGLSKKSSSKFAERENSTSR